MPVSQTTLLMAGKVPTTLRASRFRICAGSLGNRLDELERGRALPRCLKKKHDADLPFFYVSDPSVQLQNSERRTKRQESVAPHGNRTFKFSTDSSAADIPANSQKAFRADNEVGPEAGFQARLPILEAPETIHIAHFKLPVKIRAGSASHDTVPLTYRLELSRFHSISTHHIEGACCTHGLSALPMAGPVSVAVSIKAQVH
jgi:hypothetical protein